MNVEELIENKSARKLWSSPKHATILQVESAVFHLKADTLCFYSTKRLIVSKICRFDYQFDIFSFLIGEFYENVHFIASLLSTLKWLFNGLLQCAYCH